MTHADELRLRAKIDSLEAENDRLRKRVDELEQLMASISFASSDVIGEASPLGPHEPRGPR